MKIDLDQLRALYLGHLAARRSTGRRACPSSWAMAGAFDPSVSRKAKRRIAEHIWECPDCREEFQLLLEAQRAGYDPERDEDPSPSSPWPARPIRVKEPSGLTRIWQYAFVLIGLCLAISSVFLIFQRGPSSGVPRANVPALELISPTPDQAVASPPLFRWRESPGCRTYVLEIFDEEMLPLWSSEKTSHPEFLLPSEVFLRLAPGRSYYWMVTGFSPDLETQESALQRFRLRRH
jgi:hypothetical protein